MALILYDVTRLFARRRAPIATGIDRIDLKLGIGTFQRFGGNCLPIVRLDDQAVIADRAATIALLSALDRCWFSGSAPPASDAERIEALGLGIGAGFGPRRYAASASRGSGVAGKMASTARDAVDLVRKGLAVRRGRLPATRTVLYVNASHDGVMRSPGALRRLSRSADVSIVAYLHDVIPIEHPQYCRQDQLQSFTAFLRELTTERLLMVANSQATSAALSLRLQTTEPVSYINGGQRMRKIALDAPLGRAVVVYPGASSAPSVTQEDASARGAAHDFCTIGTIEPRKNHAMLLRIWRQLAKIGQRPMPRLWIIGRRGWDIADVAETLDHCAALKPHIVELADLTDREVRTILGSCRALLLPSHAEGFGLPILEAAELGKPVIASDLPVFREIIGDSGVFLAPSDEEAWRNAIVGATNSEVVLHPAKLTDRMMPWAAQVKKFTDLVELALTHRLPHWKLI